MKNALILHGTQGNSSSNWFPWLKDELSKKGYQVWLPDLPGAEEPILDNYTRFIFSNKDWQFNQDSIIIGHSSGAIAILAILNELPENIVVDKCILVSYFEKDSIGGRWKPNIFLFDYKFNFEKIKKHARRFIIIHSDNDPYSTSQAAENLSKTLGGEFILRKGEGHFNLEAGPQYKQFPFLLTLID